MIVSFSFRYFYTSLPMQMYSAAKAENTPKKGVYLMAVQT